MTVNHGNPLEGLLVVWRHKVRTGLIVSLVHEHVLLLGVDVHRRRDWHILGHDRGFVYRHGRHGHVLLAIVLVIWGRSMRIVRLLGKEILIVGDGDRGGRVIGMLRRRVFGRGSGDGARRVGAVLVFRQGGFATEAA